MKKIIITLMFCYSIFGGDFRYNNWGDSPGMMLKNENLSKVTYQKDFKSKIFNTHYGDKIYNFSEESYFFYDELESLGKFRVTFDFIDNKLYKGTYEKEINENDSSFERTKQYLIWKYGENYKTYNIKNYFEWETDRVKIIFNLFTNDRYVIEYYSKDKDINQIIENIENGTEFTKDLDTQYKEFNKIKEKL